VPIAPDVWHYLFHSLLQGPDTQLHALAFQVYELMCAHNVPVDMLLYQVLLDAYLDACDMARCARLFAPFHTAHLQHVRT
jgi:hypothetical protein